MDTYKNLIKEIEGRKFWVGEAPAIFQLCYPWIIGFINTNKYFNFGFKIVITPFKDNYTWQFLDEDENYSVIKKLVDMFIKRKISRQFKMWQQLKEKAIKNFQYIDEIDLKKLSNQDLISEYLKLMNNFTEQWTIPLILEGTAIYTERKLLPEFKKEIKQPLPNKVINEYFTILTQPEKNSFAARERLNFLKFCLTVYKDTKLLKILKKKRNKISEIKSQYPNFYNQLFNHQKNFYWIRNSYFKAEPIPIYKFLQLAKEEIKRKTLKKIKSEYQKVKNHPKNIISSKNKVLSKIRISPRIKQQLEAISFFGFWQDERKEMALRGNHYVIKFLKEFARRTKINYGNLGYTLPEEMEKVLMDNKKRWVKTLQERKKKSVFVYRFKKDYQFYLGKQAKTLWDLLFERKKKTDIKIVEGIVVSRGGQEYVRGIGRIVLDPLKDIFKNGEILITSMTRPEFVPLMRKAKAVITNEGGMTCHAAIVSRELNIPCIVGTKHATEVFESGENIELKLNHGRIQKI